MKLFIFILLIYTIIILTYINNKISTKYLIYKGSGGLTHMLRGLEYAIFLAKLSNRILIIDLNHSAFNQKFSTFFKIIDKKVKYTENYPKNLLKLKYYNYNMNTIIKKKINYNQKKYYILNKKVNNYNPFYYCFNNKYVLIFGGPAWSSIKNIKVNDNIIEKIKKEFNIKEKYMGIHFRNTDIKNNKKEFLKKIKNSLNDIKLIYLGTDDCEMYNFLKNNLNNIKIIRKTIPKCNIKNLHYTLENKYESIYNCLVDIYYLKNSNIFIPSINSGLSKWILTMRYIKKNDIFN
jgi:hypothetical protein